MNQIIIDQQRNIERDLRRDRSVLYWCCSFLLAVALYATYQCVQAKNACYEWQNLVITKGLGDGLQ